MSGMPDGRTRFTGGVSLVAFLLGPALGLAHVVHLATSGPDHEPDKCSVCVQLAASSTAAVGEPAAVGFAGDSRPAALPTPLSIVSPCFYWQAAVPRAPPLNR